MSDVDVDTVVRLGGLALKFGQVNRATFHSDGRTPESDTTHTVMLGLVACAFAQKYLPQLDVGLIAQRALVHDLVEVYAGDTNTLRTLTPEQKEDKEKRERFAFFQITQEYASSLPWVVDTLRAYEWSITPEDRYVRTMDKVLPKITHLLNDCAGLHEDGITPEELRSRFREQIADLTARTAGDHFLPVFELYDELVALVLGLFAAEYTRRANAT